MTGLPGLRGIDHVGLTVPDLDEAERFFCGVLGAAVVFDGGTIDDPETLGGVLGAPDAVTCRYRFYRLATGLNLEVFAYDPPQPDAMPANCRPGGHHIALYVDDIDAATAHLRAHGVETAGSPQFIEDGPAAGSHWLYFRTPWGLQMELVSYPHGKGYERDAETRLWSPLKPGQ